MAANPSTTNLRKPVQRSSEASASSRESLEHKVKSWPQFFEQILSGEKAHELRRNDRNFRVGDLLRLQEYDPKENRYTGRELRVKITYITSEDLPCALSESALHPGFCILSIKKV
jgi:Domain of unknown function (DUF3850)